VDPQQLAVAVDVAPHVLQGPHHVHRLAVAAVVEDLEADQLALAGDAGERVGLAHLAVLHAGGVRVGGVEDPLDHLQVAAAWQADRQPAGDHPGDVGAVAEAVDQGLAAGGPARLGEVAVQLGDLAAQGVVAAEVEVAFVDAGVEHRPGDAAAAGVVGAPGRVGLDGGARDVDQRVDREVRPDAVDGPPGRVRLLLVGVDQPEDLGGGQLAAVVGVGDLVRGRLPREVRQVGGEEVAAGAGQALAVAQVELDHHGHGRLGVGVEPDPRPLVGVDQRLGHDRPLHQRLVALGGAAPGARLLGHAASLLVLVVGATAPG